MKKSILKSLIILTVCSILVACNSTNHLPIKNGEKMFTVEQIKSAHSKVKSGADFPAYIQDIKKLGVTFYETFVADGHTDYYGANDYKTTSLGRYAPLAIADTAKEEPFKLDLKAHQQGKTDYPTFIAMCAGFGIEKWAVSMDKMTCTYYDKKGKEILTEEIPH